MGDIVAFRGPRGKVWFVGALILAAVGGASVAALDMSKVADAAINVVESAAPPQAPSNVDALVAMQPARKGMARCIGAVRVTCVVDGDTFWWKGEKIRIENIDAPEMTGLCAGEPIKAEQATKRLTQLMDGRVELQRYGMDKYGRTLARVVVDGDDIGDKLVSEGLARAWPAGRKTWCGA